MNKFVNKFDRISCHQFIEDSGYAYFSNWFYNGLFRVELKTGKTTFLKAFKNEQEYESNLHFGTMQRDERIYFFPYMGRHMHVYSLVQGEISAIEVRKATETFFRINEVVINGNDVIFLPREENAPIKTLDLNTHVVTELKNTGNVFKGIYLIRNRASFPVPQILEKYQIEKPNGFSWKQMPNGRWCAFLPMGRHLLWYTSETQKIEAVPLTVVNKEELEEYKCLIEKKVLSHKVWVENRDFSFDAYLNAVILESTVGTDAHKTEERKPVGERIWEHARVFS